MLSFFERNAKSYTITIGSKAERKDPPPTFTVTIHKSTLDQEYEDFSAALTKNSVSGLTFNISDSTTLVISINPGKVLKSSTDLGFRNAIALTNKCSLTSRDSEEIIQSYNRYLKDNDLTSAFVGKIQKSSEQLRSTGSMAF